LQRLNPQEHRDPVVDPFVATGQVVAVAGWFVDKREGALAGAAEGDECEIFAPDSIFSSSEWMRAATTSRATCAAS